MPETNTGTATPATDPEQPEQPGERECLRCYVARMVYRHGCDNTRQWTIRWRDRRAPNDQRMLEELEDRGGLCCDCEVLMNVWESSRPDWEESPNEDELQPCAGAAIKKDSLQLCALWSDLTLREPEYGYDEDEEEDQDDEDQDDEDDDDCLDDE